MRNALLDCSLTICETRQRPPVSPNQIRFLFTHWILCELCDVCEVCEVGIVALFGAFRAAKT